MFAGTRVEETYGEDPFLSFEMGVTLFLPFEKNGSDYTHAKHFIDNGSVAAGTIPWNIDERLLDGEIYLPPFKACFEEVVAMWLI